MTRMSVARAIAYNTGVQVIGKAVSLAAMVGSIALMTRYLGAAGYGHYAAALAVLQVAFIVVDFGLQMTAVTLLNDPRRPPEVTFGNLMGLRLLTALAAGGLAAGAIWLTPFPTPVKQAVAIMGLAFAAAGVAAVATAVFQQRLAMGYAAVAEVIGKLALLGGVALTLWWNGGLLGVALATVAGAAVQAGCLWGWARRLLPFRLRWDAAVWGEIVRATWPLAVTIALNLVYFKMDTIVLALSRGADEVGRYGAPYRVLELLINLGYLFLGLLLPLMAQAASRGDRARLRTVIQRGFDTMALATLPLVAGGLVVGEKLMAVVAGPAFAGSGPLLAVLLVATAIILLGAVFGYAIVALGLQRRLIPLYAGNAVLATAAYLWLIPRFGAPAAAWLTVGSELVILVAVVVVTARELRWLPRLNVLGQAALAAAVLAGVLALLPAWPLVVQLALGAGTYLAVLQLLGGVPTGLLREIVKPSNIQR